MRSGVDGRPIESMQPGGQKLREMTQIVRIMISRRH